MGTKKAKQMIAKLAAANGRGPNVTGPRGYIQVGTSEAEPMSRFPTTKRLRVSLMSVFEFDKEMSGLPFTDEQAQLMALYEGFGKVARKVFGGRAHRIPGEGHHTFKLEFNKPRRGRKGEKG